MSETDGKKKIRKWSFNFVSASHLTHSCFHTLIRVQQRVKDELIKTTMSLVSITYEKDYAENTCPFIRHFQMTSFFTRKRVLQ